MPKNMHKPAAIDSDATTVTTALNAKPSFDFTISILAKTSKVILSIKNYFKPRYQHGFAQKKYMHSCTTQSVLNSTLLKFFIPQITRKSCML